MADDMDTEEKKELDLSSQEVVTKYKDAADIANKALNAVIAASKVGAKVIDLCELGDKTIRDLSSAVYKNSKKKIERGVAFPTSVSVNNIVCHYSPLQGDTLTLSEGDLVKIDLAAHIDGFIAVVAHTIVVQEEDKPITGRAADVIAAANTAAEAALRLVRPGKKNGEVTEILQRVADCFDCRVVEGVLTHQQKQFVLDGNKVALNVTNTETRVDEFEFEENEVYGVDIVMSTGEGKPKVTDEKETLIFKRAIDKSYSLKLKASRALLSEVSQKFPVLPFSARYLEDMRGARLGLVECVNHELLQPYPVLREKQGDLVAHLKFTVLLLPTGSHRVTGFSPTQTLQSERVMEDEQVKAVLAMGLRTKKKGGGKKKKAKRAAEEGEAGAEEGEGEQ